MSRPAVNERGGIDADLTLSAYARHRMREGEYRYLSPALYLDAEAQVTGLSSVAIVNDPNFETLRAPQIHGRSGPTAGDGQEPTIAERERRADERDRRPRTTSPGASGRGASPWGRGRRRPSTCPQTISHRGPSASGRMPASPRTRASAASVPPLVRG